MNKRISNTPKLERWRLAAGLAIGSVSLALSGCGDDAEDYATTDRETEVVAVEEQQAPSTQQQTASEQQVAAQEQEDQTQSARHQFAPEDAQVQDSAEITLREEHLNIEKRAEPAGGVLLRKKVVSEPADETVELRREDIEVVRLSPEEARERMEAGASSEFNEEFSEEEVFIPIMREEAVAEKEVETREVVQASTEVQTEQKQIEETLRREELEAERVMQDEQQRQQYASSEQESQGLKEKVMERLRSETDLSDQQVEQLEVEVENRNVTVSGSVPDEQMKSQIREEIQKIEGVASVDFKQ